jgi:hypothetical protein
MAQPRIVIHDKFDSTGFTNENTLARALLTKPDTINPVITHLAGREDKKFPLTFLTEGQKGGYKTIEVNDIQYDWPTIGKTKNGDRIVSTTYQAGDKPGINHSPFYITTEGNWLKVQHIVMSPNGVQARVMERGKPVGSGRYLITLQLNGVASTDFCPLSELQPGTTWVMVGGAPVSESFSMGNESNVQTPGKMKNQISILRKSYKWGGNLTNKTVEVQFNVNGTPTNYWMPFEEWQHMMNWKQACEEHYWYSKYNRNADGSISMIDYDTELPIPTGAGVDDQITNRDTYSFLTYKKIKETVGDVMYGATDTGEMNVVLYTGLGGMEDFHEALLDKSSGFSQITGDKFVTGSGRNLMLTGFFASFQHIDGHVVSIKHLPLLDKGARADNAPKHPITNKPITSYDMYFLDQSMYDGSPNVQMVAQKGRAMRRGVIKGMAPLGMKADGSDFNGNDVISTEKDENSIHFLSSKGICIRRATHCFKLSCNLS